MKALPMRSLTGLTPMRKSAVFTGLKILKIMMKHACDDLIADLGKQESTMGDPVGIMGPGPSFHTPNDAFGIEVPTINFVEIGGPVFRVVIRHNNPHSKGKRRP